MPAPPHRRHPRTPQRHADRRRCEPAGGGTVRGWQARSGSRAQALFGGRRRAVCV